MATLMTTMAFSSIAYAMPQAEPTVENTGTALMIYLAPGGAYARISSDYIKNNSSSATAIAVLYP